MMKKLYIICVFQFLFGVNSVFAADVWLIRAIRDNLVRLYTEGAFPSDKDLRGRPYSYYLWPIKVPIVHPYCPTEGLPVDPTTDMPKQMPEFTVTAQLPNIKADDIPSTQIRKDLQGNGVFEVERFVVIQNNPWKKGTEILFRPQPWLHRDVEYTKGAWIASPVTAYYAPINGVFEKIKIVNNWGRSKPDEVITNDSSGALVFSENTLKIGPKNNAQTIAFYTFCIDRNRQRAAITLHVMCDDRDHNSIKASLFKLKEGESLLLTTLFGKSESESTREKEAKASQDELSKPKKTTEQKEESFIVDKCVELTDWVVVDEFPDWELIEQKEEKAKDSSGTGQPQKPKNQQKRIFSLVNPKALQNKQEQKVLNL